MRCQENYSFRPTENIERIKSSRSDIYKPLVRFLVSELKQGDLSLVRLSAKTRIGAEMKT